jgi:hypothetical protein
MARYTPDLNWPYSEAGDVDETGWFGSKLAKKVGGAVKSAVKTVSKVPGVSLMTSQARFIGDVASGKNVLKSARRGVSNIVADTRRSLPLAAGVVSFVPGVGTGVASGLSAASALSQGKSLRGIAEEAALGAVPGGQLVRAAVKTGIGVAKGQNVLRTVAREGVNYAAQQLPGGQLAQRALTVGTRIAKGENIGNIAKSEVTREISNVAKSYLPGVPMQLLKTRPSFGQIVSAGPEIIGRGRGMIHAVRPQMRRAFSNVPQKAAFRPLSVNAYNALVRAMPQFRPEVAGLTESGTQWKVEKGDTGSKIALALTGNANRWTELRPINKGGLRANADMVKKYGFPVQLGEKLNLPASWITVKPTQTAAQAAPATPEPAKPPPVEMPEGNFAAQSQARAILATWGKTDGANESGTLADYGGSAELNSKAWSARDVMQAMAFSNWWKRFGGPPSVEGGDWSDNLAKALNIWTEKKVAQVTAAAQAATGMQIPTIPPIPGITAPIPAPVPVAVMTTPSASVPTPSPMPSPAPTPSIAIPPGALLSIPSIIANNLPAPMTQAPPAPPATPTAAQSAAPATSPGLSDREKWSYGSLIGSALLTAAINALA